MNIIKFVKCVAYAVSIFSITLAGFLIPLDQPEAPEYMVDKDPATLKSPPKPYRWKIDPDVIVCEDSMVTKEAVKAAMAYWYERGYYFGELFFHEDPKSKCDDNSPDNHIVIRKVTSSVRREMHPDTLAETRFQNDVMTGTLEYAKIYIVEKPTERVLEHEFGHTLGFMHYNKPGHLMHARIPIGGWDDHGLRDMRRRATEKREAAAAARKGTEE